MGRARRPRSAGGGRRARLVSVAASGRALWTPAQIGASLLAWYDAADTASISIATGVSQWSDKSGGGRHLVQSVGSQQPAYETNGLNNLPTVAFDGSNDSLRSSPLSYPWAAPLAQPYTVVQLARPVPFAKAGGALNSRVWSAWDPNFGGSGQSQVFEYNQTYAGAVLLRQLVFPDFWGAIDIWSDVGVPLINQSIVMTATVFNGASSYRRTYGTQGSNVSVTNRGLYGLTLGATGLGLSGTSDWADVRYSEFLVLSGSPATATLELIEGYLAWKWGVVAGLPAGHPYKSLIPKI
jgi:hypothetical protein